MTSQCWASLCKPVQDNKLPCATLPNKGQIFQVKFAYPLGNQASWMSFAMRRSGVRLPVAPPICKAVQACARFAIRRLLPDSVPSHLWAILCNSTQRCDHFKLDRDFKNWVEDAVNKTETNRCSTSSGNSEVNTSALPQHFRGAI